MARRYLVQYGQRDQRGYIVLDAMVGRVIYQSDSKSEAIEYAQRVSGFDVIDGNERTYSLQTGS
jgi:hypothetical protein